MQKGYDHSYFFVSTFMEDHVSFHAQAFRLRRVFSRWLLLARRFRRVRWNRSCPACERGAGQGGVRALAAERCKLTAAAKGMRRRWPSRTSSGHAGKDYLRFSSRIKRQGYGYSTAAENIAAGQKSAGQVVASWLGSAGHRRNILNCAMRDTGIAVVYQPDDRPIRGNQAPCATIGCRFSRHRGEGTPRAATFVQR